VQQSILQLAHETPDVHRRARERGGVASSGAGATAAGMPVVGVSACIPLMINTPFHFFFRT
jgi:hypothetical protein